MSSTTDSFNSNVTAAPGSIGFDAGTSGTTWWLKHQGSGNTGWEALPVSAGTVVHGNTFAWGTVRASNSVISESTAPVFSGVTYGGNIGIATTSVNSIQINEIGTYKISCGFHGFHSQATTLGMFGLELFRAGSSMLNVYMQSDASYYPNQFTYGITGYGASVLSFNTTAGVNSRLQLTWRYENGSSEGTERFSVMDAWMMVQKLM